MVERKSPQQCRSVQRLNQRWLPQPSTMSDAAHPLKVHQWAQYALVTRKAVRV
jgi:hypothetical protein